MVSEALQYPAPDVLLEMELETVEFLRGDSQVSSDFPDLAAKASLVILATKKPPRLLVFGSHMLLNDPEDGLRIDIGVTIEAAERRSKYQNLSYFFAVSRAEDEFQKVMRKMHFDHAPCNLEARTAHPFSHIQYAGTLAPCMREAGFTDASISHMNPDFEGPRIPCPPISLAMLIHLLLREFPDTNGTKLIERSDWRSLVRRNEELLLKDFHWSCWHQIHVGKRLISDLFYYDP